MSAAIVKWPMSVLRLAGDDTDRICELSGKILAKWRGYTDEEAFIFAETDGTPHNTITPIARFRNGKFEIDLVLRNNITTEEYPDGVYHPHPQHHHIKKENIGLIEVMGLAVLPSRLKTEMATLKDAIIKGKDILANEAIAKHYNWVEEIKKNNTITDENCKAVTELKNFEGEVISPAMTWFENSLGGKIVVMGMTLRGNNSFSLFHGARQNLIQNLISKISGTFFSPL